MDGFARTSMAPVAAVGLVALASAMGVGRFAFTPFLPLMQDEGLSLVEGSWLASANYAGYFAGALALSIVRPLPARLARFGLVAIALLTATIGCTEDRVAWIVLRGLAGGASACVLVGVSGWALPRLASSGRASSSGVVFAGVGIGIFIAGSLGAVAGALHIASKDAWIALGIVSATAAAFAWPYLVDDDGEPRLAVRGHRKLNERRGLLVASYGAFGFGYILPATFLPALAREVLAQPAWVGLAWPVFGIAAAVSTLFVSTRLRDWPPARTWSIAQAVMAIGVIAPVCSHSLAAILAGALLVGGTFMVITMAGIQHAQRVAGDDASGLVAAMTASFAFGQLVGPLTLPRAETGMDAIAVPSILAVLALLAGAFALARHARWESPAI